MNSFDLFVEVSGCGNDWQAFSRDVNFLKLHINDAFMAMIHRKQGFCQIEDGIELNSDGDCLETEIKTLWASEPKHDRDEDWYLIVDKERFRFEGHSGGIAVAEFCGMTTAELAHYLEVMGNDVNMTNGLGPIVTITSSRNHSRHQYMWHGESLFFSIDDVGKLLTNVLKVHPELGARQVAINMEAQISQGKTSPGTADTAGQSRLSTVPTRKRGVRV